MVSNKTKKAICIAVALSLMANLSPQVYAGDLVAIPQNNSSIIIPPNSSIIQSNSTNFSMKSIEAKMSNILNPAKKEGRNKVNRKALDAYGSCGDGVTYTFTASTGKLIISKTGYGSGAMTDYQWDSPASPWYSYRDSIKSVTIGNSVTSIGSYAFSCCSGLTSITIPDSVTTTGEGAFYGCSGLTSITIPDSVTTIGEGSFARCSNLTSITIPDSVTTISSEAFDGCSGLTSITIPDSVTSIGDFAVSGCSGLTSITIPDSVTSIGSYAFADCSGLTEVTYLGRTEPQYTSYLPFCNCNNLNEVEVSNRYKKDIFCNIPINRSLAVVSLCGDGKQQYFDSNAKKIIVCKNPTNRCKYQPRSFTLFNIGLLPI